MRPETSDARRGKSFLNLLSVSCRGHSNCDELDFEARAAKNAIQQLGRSSSFAGFDRKRTQALCAGQHYRSISGGCPDGRLEGLRHVFARAAQKVRNFREKIRQRVIPLLEKRICENALLNILNVEEFTADCDRRKLGESGPDHRQKLKAIHVRHSQICNDEIGHDSLDFSESCESILSYINGVARLFEDCT